MSYMNKTTFLVSDIKLHQEMWSGDINFIERSHLPTEEALQRKATPLCKVDVCSLALFDGLRLQFSCPY